ncbi:hypothetical protein ABT142_22730 [Streptomyces sp. NPDC001857]|uniref:hypothetical protein n=1 Tax=unclassified Streptomyces TaxID=2593676 RepID=UPI003324882D
MAPNHNKRPAQIRAAIIAGVLAIVGAVLAAIIGVLPAWGGDKTDGVRECLGQRVDLTAPARVGPEYDITVEINCLPPTGEKYVLITEMSDVGRKGTEHTLYCPRLEPELKEGAKTYRRSAAMSPVGSVRTLYMYSLTAEEEQQIEANVVDGDCVTSLPTNADKVSNSVQVKRTY